VSENCGSFWVTPIVNDHAEEEDVDICSWLRLKEVMGLELNARLD